MSTTQAGKPWDFSQVRDLVNALSSPQPSGRDDRDGYILAGDLAKHVESPAPYATDVKDFARSTASLGDFGKIWQFLGTQPSPSLDHVATDSIKSQQQSFSSKDDYTSDGAIRYGLRSKEKKTVTWKEETSADEPGTDSASELSATPTPIKSKLTKSQRKKQNRKARKAKDSVFGLGTVSESEADSGLMVTPARKASTHAIPSQPTHRYNLRQRSTPALDVTTTTLESGTNGHVNQNDKPKINITQHISTTNSAQAPSHLSTNMRSHSQPSTSAAQMSHSHAGQNTTQWPVPSASSLKSSNPFFPSSICPPVSTPQKAAPQHAPLLDSAAKAIAAVQAAQAQLQTTPTPKGLPKRAPMIEPKIVRSGEDRHMALLLKLLNDFSQDRKYLVSPMNLTTHNNDPKGIHIFVDASNIFIGFNDQLKRSRGIPQMTRVPPVELSFDALALLMERRRPVAKRVLLGSTPWLAAFDKAQAVGYECSILEKVYKKRELTERQIYFRDAPRRHSGRAKAAPDPHENAGLLTTPPLNKWQSNTEDWNSGHSGSETPSGPQFDREKWIEQGVDEILHLKIAQSMLDCGTPSTMIIATGDAAQAEYSDGFGAMVRRALDKGWKVEIVSWSKNISSMYLARSFRDRWKDQFSVVFLDDYAEELLDM